MNRAGKGIVGVGYGSSINPQKKKGFLILHYPFTNFKIHKILSV